MSSPSSDRSGGPGAVSCAGCGSPNREGRRFCSACRATLSAACPQCGFTNEPGDRFCGGCGAVLGGAPAPVERRAPTAPMQDAPQLVGLAERRQVTILFADIAGFTRLSRRLDPEDTHAMLQGFFGATDAIVESFGGTVDKHVGDAVMALFGAPIAHGDDPVRAVRAAVEIHRAAAALGDRSPEPFRVHVGIASGEVVAGGIGREGSTEYTVIGNSVNLAARLEEQASGGETLISDTVFNAASGVVTCEPVKLSDGGIGEVTAWRVLALKEELSDRPRSPIVGRESELRHFDSLMKAAQSLRRGEALLLRGDAGIGKTRLVEEYASLAIANGFRHHGAQVLDFGAGEGQDAIRILVRSLLGLGAGDGPERRLAGISAAVARGLVPPEQEIFLMDLLALPPPARFRAVYEAMDNITRLEGKRSALANLLRKAARDAPLLLTIEDLHWASAVTLDFLSGMLESIRDIPVAVVMTTRTEGDPMGSAWRGGLRGVSLMAINLSPLGRAEAERLAAQFVHRSKKHVDDCIERADGNPLFLEQLLSSAEDQRDTNLPATIQRLVLARLDRLGPAERQALQAASVIGLRFRRDTLDHLLGGAAFDPAPLLDAHLIRPDGEGFQFTHSLIREGAYSALLHSRARELHRRAADHFRSNDPTLCAEHLDKARDPEAPAAYLAAARLQQANYHLIHARMLVERALEIASDARIRFDLLSLLGELLRGLGEAGGSLDAYREALDVAPEDPDRCRARIGMVEAMRDGQQLDEAIALLAQAEAIAVEHDLVEERARIHGQRGNLFFPRGELEAGREQQQLSLRFAKLASSPALEARALGGLGDSEYARGRMATARGHFADCVALCRTHDFVRIEAANLSMRGLTSFYCGDPRSCIEDCRAAIEVAASAHQRRAELVARTAGVFAQLEMLDIRGGREHCRRAMELVDNLGARRFEAECLCFMARFLMLEGRAAEAERQALDAVEASLESPAGRSFTGPLSLGTLALAASDPARRRKALEDGEGMLREGCVSHNHFWFRRDAIEVCLVNGDADGAIAQAEALAAYTAEEPLGWLELYIALARSVAGAEQDGWTPERRAGLKALRRRAEEAGFVVLDRLAGRMMPAEAGGADPARPRPTPPS